ncbi:preprotein translocase subunit TatA [Methylocystis sp. 9N]|uniref:Preprotein translocase subunit TatA n=1 Tax=Methylocystis borbori TaxID=3118750 RepID=A0ABU7XKY4_9HYPH
MFDLDPGKLIVIGIVALVAIPAKDLPRVLRTLGQYAGKMRRMASEFQGQFMDAMREADLENLRKEVDAAKAAIGDAAKLDSSFDPMREARKQIVDAIEGETPSRAQRPHFEQPSASEEEDAALASFETRPAAAPQDEAADFPQVEPKKAAT